MLNMRDKKKNLRIREISSELFLEQTWNPSKENQRDLLGTVYRHSPFDKCITF